MKVAGIIAEFNPFHNGHKYIIEKSRKDLGADYVVVVMSGDYVQRGAPALVSKFARTKMALESGADLVLELPLYYSIGSAEYFAEGAVSVLDGLGVVTDLVFGSEFDDISALWEVASILAREPDAYKTELKEALSAGDSFPTARSKAICAAIARDCNDNAQRNITSTTPREAISRELCTDITSSPNTILALEYLKTLIKRGSTIKPHPIKRIGAGYEDISYSEGSTEAPGASALGIRKLLEPVSGSFAQQKGATKEKQSVYLNSIKGTLLNLMPEASYQELLAYPGTFLDCNSFSQALHYKLTLEKAEGYSKYLDVSTDLSNRIAENLSDFESYEQFCSLLKTKNLTYTRISRCLMHVLLNITGENMNSYKADGFTSYGRILGMKKEASQLLARIHETSVIPVPGKLKDFEKELSPEQFGLFRETLTAGEIYNQTAVNGISSEYKLRPIIL